jgi:hypothetical protein
MKNDDIPKQKLPATMWLLLLLALAAIVLTIWGFARAGAA